MSPFGFSYQILLLQGELPRDRLKSNGGSGEQLKPGLEDSSPVSLRVGSVNTEFKWLVNTIRVYVAAPKAHFVFAHGMIASAVGMPLVSLTIDAIVVVVITEAAA
jgi:hypothetical protein